MRLIPRWKATGGFELRGYALEAIERLGGAVPKPS